jgi:hypothetical protein
MMCSFLFCRFSLRQCLVLGSPEDVSLNHTSRSTLSVPQLQQKNLPCWIAEGTGQVVSCMLFSSVTKSALKVERIKPSVKGKGKRLLNTVARCIKCSPLSVPTYITCSQKKYNDFEGGNRGTFIGIVVTSSKGDLGKSRKSSVEP